MPVKRYRHQLREFLTDNSSLGKFVLSALLLTVFGQLLYDLAFTVWGFSGVVGLLGLVLIVIVLGIWWIEWLATHWRKGQSPRQSPIEARKGLVLLMSVGSRAVDLGLTSIGPHARAGALRHCWIIFSPGSRHAASDLAGAIRTAWPEVMVYHSERYLVDSEDIETTWQVIQSIYETELSAQGLSEGDVIADITGGTKPMTAGMALACQPRDREMQYVVTPRDPDTGDLLKDREGYPELITTRRFQPSDLESPDGP